MPFPMKIQPIEAVESIRSDPIKTAVKSRFKRLFERQFTSVLRGSAAEKPGEPNSNKDGSNGGDLEPSSVCLAKMVQSFIEEANESKASKCGRNRCNCFNRNCSDSSDDELDFFGGGGFGFGDSLGTNAGSSAEGCDFLKSLVSCATIAERNLLADTAKIVETNKSCMGKDNSRTIVTDGLLGLCYDASICKSKWDKSPSYPAGEHEYIDVIVEGERLLVDIDFRSEFEIARSTKKYRAVLQSLPPIFVGKTDRLQQIVSVVSEAAKQSLKKKGMHFPPWRKAEYMRAKWLSSHTRLTTQPPQSSSSSTTTAQFSKSSSTTQPNSLTILNEIVSKPSFTTTLTTPPPTPIKPITEDSSSSLSFSGELELIFREEEEEEEEESDPAEERVASASVSVAVSPWQPPAVRPKNPQTGGKMVTGLASILKEKP
ncbi:hypothetical protein Sjap_006440 [Stephania japonica]|uniref:Uncharacterized protein n=1 Tax=Stephania japonica TaxID=461633 RepID=A0AAP0K898_9MAGN